MLRVAAIAGHTLARRRRGGVRRRYVGTGLLVLASLVGLGTGCRAGASFPGSLNSPRPEERVRATKMAVGYAYASPAERRTALELLVGRLDDEDDAVRFFAILALEKMTGTRLGYEYHAPAADRARAIQSWRRYLAEQAKPVNVVRHTNAGGQAHPAAGTERNAGGGGSLQ